MFNNRQYINNLKEEIERLEAENEWIRKAMTYWRERCYLKDKEIEKLEKDIEELKFKEDE